jgi:hypothetical protein
VDLKKECRKLDKSAKRLGALPGMPWDDYYTIIQSIGNVLESDRNCRAQQTGMH